MRFPYLAMPTKRPVYPLGGLMARYLPIFSVHITGPQGSRSYDGHLDSASGDTVFPKKIADELGIDLTGAPEGEAAAVGGVVIPYRYAPVTLRLSDGRETCVWEAIVGFVDLPLHWALFGQTGFLQCFDAALMGSRREVVIDPNDSFPGQRIVA